MGTSVCLIIWLTVFHLQVDSAPIPENWKDYIAKEMLNKYDGKSLDGFSEENFQGDIGGIDKGLPIDELQNQLNNAINDEGKRWPNGVVPYVLSEKFLEDDRRLEKEFILAAMNNIASHSGHCVKFVPRTTEPDYIHIARGMHCRSDVGRSGGKQYIFLTRGCLEEIGLIQHELLHALGFYHENSRADRDDYVLINWKNLLPAAAEDFKIPTDAVTFGLPYDYDSVLHYRHNAFAINNSAPTIIPKEKGRGIGQSSSLSTLDIVKLKRAYNCPEKEYERVIGSMAGKTTTAFAPLLISPMQGRTTSKTETTESVTVDIKTTTSGGTNLALMLPEWKAGELSDDVCRSLETKDCILKNLNCRDGFFYFQCNRFLVYCCPLGVSIRKHFLQ